MENLDTNTQIKLKQTSQANNKYIGLVSEESRNKNELFQSSTALNKKNISNQYFIRMTLQPKKYQISEIEGEEVNNIYEKNENESDKKNLRDDEFLNSSSSNTSSEDESETTSEDKIESLNLDPNRSSIIDTVNVKQFEENKNDEITDDSDIEDDLVSAINYNTITSLAALKDMLQSSGEESEGVDSFFHHYFLSHVNRLPSRNQTHSPYPWGRRLSECREEDEYETEEGKINDNEANKENIKKIQRIQNKDSEEKSENFIPKVQKLSSENLCLERIDHKSNQNSTVLDSRSIPCTLLSRFVTHTVTSPTSTKPLYRRNTTGPGMIFPETDPPSYSNNMTFLKISPFPSPHLDKRFFDSSLVEMKSEASSSSTLDYDSTDEIWVRRIDLVHERKKRVSTTSSIKSIKPIDMIEK